MKKLLTILLLLTTASTYAKVELNPLWGDNMVVQRNHEVIFWGSSTAKKGGITITPSWSSESYKATIGKDGKWRTTIPTPEAGGPYTITFNDGDELKLNDVLLGDVWLLTGQSNMEMRMRGNIGQPIVGSARAISQARPERNIRMLSIDNIAAQQPQDNLPDLKWGKNTSEVVAEFSAAGYFFGLDVESALNIPIGLINCSWGGSLIESWMSPEWLSKLKEYDLSHLKEEKIRKAPNRIPVYLYNGMISPLRDLSIKGALWYQGEGNRTNPEEYLTLFPSFVAGLRQHLNGGEFPFYYAQIAPFTANNEYSWVYMRETMGKLMALTPRTGMITLTDIGEQTRIHPRFKKVVGERFALYALGDCYGVKGFDYRAPEYREVKLIEATGKQPAKLAVCFDYAANGLSFVDRDWKSENFEIAGEDQVFYPALVKVIPSKSNHQLEVWSDKVAKPVAVRYAYKNFVIGDLYNNFGIPVSSFRSDEWNLKTK